MLAEVRARTGRAVASVEALELGRQPGGDAGREAFDAEVRQHVSRWMREMEALGLEVCGPWQVEFDGEAGAFCWTWPDERLRFRAKDEKEATPIQ